MFFTCTAFGEVYNPSLNAKQRLGQAYPLRGGACQGLVGVRLRHLAQTLLQRLHTVFWF